MCCSSTNESFTSDYLDKMMIWRDKAQGCCDHLGRRIVMEAILITAIPIALIEITARAVFQILNALVWTALLPCCCCFKVPMVGCKVLGDTLCIIPMIALQIIVQPFMPADP